MKLWGGRFTKSTNSITDDFNSSIHFDKRLYKDDILGSMAHAKMLGKQNIITLEESVLIQKTLSEILVEIENGLVEFEVDAEDIHMNIEKILISKIGDTGKKLHTGRSRNDQVALDLRMNLKTEITEIKSYLFQMQNVILKLSNENLETIMPGYTHLQKAQPITLAHHLMAYFQMFSRDIDRLNDCFKRTNVMPLGSGALAGTTYPLDRNFVAKELSFDSITENSLDSVSDRDFVLELSSTLSILMMHFSRFSEEIILWATNEFSFIELDDAYSTGSSIMPQKKNPDIAELVRGKTGRVYGNLVCLLTVMKGLPLAYNKDMQEDKEAIFDCVDTVKMCITIFSKMLETLKVNKENMFNSTQLGFTNATDVADYLVKNGLPFRDAHEVSGKIVVHCINLNKAISELPIETLKSFSNLIGDDFYEEISLKKCVDGRNTYGGPAKEAVLTSIENGKKFVETQNA